MVISYICGGLGNQMFQYAAGRRLAAHLGTELKLDLSEYGNGMEQRPEAFAEFRRPVKLYELSVTESSATAVEIAALQDPFRNTTLRSRLGRRVRKYLIPDWKWPASHVREKQYRFDPAILSLGDRSYLDGFWQSWKYFDDVAPAIRSAFEPRDRNIATDAHSHIDKLRQLGGPVVALHVRRGDLAHAAETLKDVTLVHGSPVGLDYIRAAIAKFDSTVRFLVFSDTAKDIAWCRANISAPGLSPDRLHFSEGQTDIQDMASMSACDHNIIANSTFSWWAAWLNSTPGRRVIAPGRWSPPGATLRMVIDDLIPPSWELI